MLRVLAFLSINLYANQTMGIAHNKTCIFSGETGMLIGVLDYWWFSALQVIDCFFTVFAFMITGIVEFLYSKVPYSMKGIFIGIFISIFSVFTILGVAIFIPLS